VFLYDTFNECGPPKKNMRKRGGDDLEATVVSKGPQGVYTGKDCKNWKVVEYVDSVFGNVYYNCQ